MPEPQPSQEFSSQAQPSAEDPSSSLSQFSTEDRPSQSQPSTENPSSQSQSSSENPSQPRRPKIPTHPRQSRSYQQYQRQLQRDAQCRNVNGARRQNTRHAPNHDSPPNDVVQSNNAGHSNNTCHSIVSNFSNPVIHNANHFHNGPPPYPPMAGVYGFDGQTVRLFQPGLGVPTQTFNFPTAGYYQEPAYRFQAPPYEGVPHQDYSPQQGYGPYQGYGPAVPSWFRPEQSWPGSCLPVSNLVGPMTGYQMTPMYPMASFQEYHGSGLGSDPVAGQWGYPAAHPETSPVADLYAYPEAAGPIDAANSAPISRGDHEVDTRASCPPLSLTGIIPRSPTPVPPRRGANLTAKSHGAPSSPKTGWIPAWVNPSHPKTRRQLTLVLCMTML